MMRKGQESHNPANSGGFAVPPQPCALVGRETELNKLLRFIRNRKSLHIYGDEGTGKSALLDRTYDNWQEIDDSLVPIYCRSSRTLRQILLCLAAFLLDYFKHLESVDKFKQIKDIKSGSDIKKLSIRALRNIVYAYISKDNFCVILDHLEYVTPKINGFLTILYERALVITASKQSWELTDYRFRGNLGYCLYLTPKLYISKLSRHDTHLLMERLWSKLQLEVLDKAGLFEQVFVISGGNPKMIVEIMNRAGMKPYFRGGECNLKLIRLDIMIEKPLQPRRRGGRALGNTGSPDCIV
jgi:hypothetical protein